MGVAEDRALYQQYIGAGNYGTLADARVWQASQQHPDVAYNVVEGNLNKVGKSIGDAENAGRTLTPDASQLRDALSQAGYLAPAGTQSTNQASASAAQLGVDPRSLPPGSPARVAYEQAHSQQASATGSVATNPFTGLPQPTGYDGSSLVEKLKQQQGIATGTTSSTASGLGMPDDANGNSTVTTGTGGIQVPGSQQTATTTSASTGLNPTSWFTDGKLNQQAMLTDLANQYQSSYDTAKASNESRYNQMMTGYNDLYAQQMATVDQMGGQQRTDIQDEFRNAASAGQQKLVSSGLSNTTIGAGVGSAYEKQKQYSLNNLENYLAQQKLGYQSQTLTNQLGAMERRTDEYPDMSLLAAMAQNIGTDSTIPDTTPASTITNTPSSTNTGNSYTSTVATTAKKAGTMTGTGGIVGGGGGGGYPSSGGGGGGGGSGSSGVNRGTSMASKDDGTGQGSATGGSGIFIYPTLPDGVTDMGLVDSSTPTANIGSNSAMGNSTIPSDLLPWGYV